MLIQSQRPAHHPTTTAHLAQTMSLLALSSAELGQKIEAALSKNPALEVIEERRCPRCRRPLLNGGLCLVCSAPGSKTADNPIVFISPRRDFRSFSGLAGEDDDASEEDWVADVVELPTYVLRQIAPELAPADRPLAAHLLTSLNEDGLLTIPLIEVARYHHTSLGRVEAVQRLIQHADPVGVGSGSPQEALLVQLDILEETGAAGKSYELAKSAVRLGMDLMSRRAYPELGRKLGISARQAALVAGFITDNLNPYPARAHWGDIRQGAEPRQNVQQPDIVIGRLNDRKDTPLVVEIVSPYAGSLRVNPMFRQAISQAPDDKTEAWQADLDEATLLVKCLQQRDNTLVRMMQRLVVLQREYILNGDACIVPLTRAQLAEELQVHESTISRAVAGKAVQLPNRRITPLARWFDRSLNVRTALLQIIADEKQPLSDTQIARLLERQGYDVARRTVAKYRSIEGILPARLRQN